jgi:hypothetical protein
MGQLNEWHRLYIEQTCVSIMHESKVYESYALPDGTIPTRLIHFAVAKELEKHSNLSVIQAFRYGMMNIIHKQYGDIATVKAAVEEFHKNIAHPNVQKAKRSRIDV